MREREVEFCRWVGGERSRDEGRRLGDQLLVVKREIGGTRGRDGGSGRRLGILEKEWWLRAREEQEEKSGMGGEKKTG